MPAVYFVLVYAFLLLCIPSQLVVGPLGAPGSPANLWAIFGLLWWCLATLRGQNPVRGWTPLRIGLGLLATAVVLSYINGTANGWYSPADIHQQTDDVWSLVAVQPATMSAKMISAADRGLLSFAGWSGILLISCEGLRSWADLERVGRWLVVLGSLVASLGIIQYFTAIDIASFFKIPGLTANSEFGEVQSRSVLNRVSSTAVHPIEFGMVMAAIFFLALHRALFASRSLLRWLPVLLIGVAIPMSVSRSAILAVAIMAMIAIFGWPGRYRFSAVLVLPFAVVGLRLLAPGLIGTIRSLFTNLFNDPSYTGRTDDYSEVLSIYREHALLGRGLYTFVAQYYRILDNQMLLSLIELGAVGVLALAILLITGFLLARAARRRATTDKERDLALVISAGIAGLVLSYFTFDAWGFPMVAGLTFLLIGMAGAASRITREAAGVSESAATRAAARGRAE